MSNKRETALEPCTNNNTNSQDEEQNNTNAEKILRETAHGYVKVQKKTSYVVSPRALFSISHHLTFICFLFSSHSIISAKTEGVPRSQWSTVKEENQVIVSPPYTIYEVIQILVYDLWPSKQDESPCFTCAPFFFLLPYLVDASLQSILRDPVDPPP